MFHMWDMSPCDEQRHAGATLHHRSPESGICDREREHDSGYACALPAFLSPAFQWDVQLAVIFARLAGAT